MLLEFQPSLAETAEERNPPPHTKRSLRDVSEGISLHTKKYVERVDFLVKNETVVGFDKWRRKNTFKKMNTWKNE